MYEKLPQELKGLRHWVCFRLVPDKKKPEKPRKVPINPMTGGEAKSNDPTTWSDFGTAIATQERLSLDGIGFMFSGSGYFGVDLDGVANVETGEMAPQALEVVEALNSYTEWSPSGTGLHVICRGALPPGARRSGFLEMYDTGRYFTMTGRIFGQESPVMERSAEVVEIHKKYLAKKPKVNQTDVVVSVDIGDDDLFRIISRSRGGDQFLELYRGKWEGKFESQSQADLSLCNSLAFWTGKDAARMDELFRKSGLMREKWGEMRGEKTYGQITIEEAIAGTNDVYRRTLSSTGNTKCQKCLSISAKSADSAEKSADNAKKSADSAKSAFENGSLVPFASTNIPQLDGENSEAYAAFQLYINMQDRSLIKYSELTGKSINTVRKWSSKYRWKERALISANVQASEAVTGEKAPEVLPANDTGNALRLQRDHGDSIRFCNATGFWYIWDGKCWQPDTSTEIKRLADLSIKKMYDELKQIEGSEQQTKFLKWIHRSMMHTTKNNMVVEAQHLEGIAIEHSDLDADHWLLNCENGTIDLRTGEIKPHEQADHITRLAPVIFDPEAKAPRWEAFIDRVMDGNQDLIRFLQKAVGYSMTGSNREQVFFMLYGSGSNGKSTFIEMVQHMLGPYAKTASASSFMEKGMNNSQTNDIAALTGMRFVSAAETKRGKALDEALMKQLTGGEKVSVRFLNKEFFEMTPTFKIWIGTNHKPNIKGDDYGIWRRVRLIPFTVTISDAEKDEELLAKLTKELPGIFNWALQGCMLWQKEKLGLPEEIADAVTEYKSDMDVIADFLEQCTVTTEFERTYSSDIYKAYCRWCDESGEKKLSQRYLTLRLKERGYECVKIHGLLVFKNLKVINIHDNVNNYASSKVVDFEKKRE